MPQNIPKLSELLKDSCVRLISPQGFTILIIKFKDDELKENIVWGYSEPAEIGKPLPTLAEVRSHMIEVTSSWKSYEELKIVLESTPDENFIRPYKLHAIRVMNGNPLGTPTRVTLLGDAAHAMTTHRGLGKRKYCYTRFYWRFNVTSVVDD
jgi:hypothetical protein